VSRAQRRLAVFLASLAVLLAAGVAGGAWWARHAYMEPGPLEAARNVVVPRGGLDEVAAALQQNGVIDRPAAFRAAALLTSLQGPMHAAELAFPPHASLQLVLSVLRTARPVQHRITIPEGLTGPQIALIVQRAEALQGDAKVPPEGSVLPDTYAYEYDTSRAALIGRMTEAMQTALAREWSTRAPDLPLASPYQALTLASIVERETSRPEERAKIAAVYLNRLKLGMKLQADPTVAFAATGGLTLDHHISRADLDRETPFNTYRAPGLPPGPICSPGLASLHAVLHPAQSDDLYFVADGSGGHAFAHTLAEHEANVARWKAQ
jgi:UPF0755 protein